MYTIAARGSRLSMTQSRLVVHMLQRAVPDVQLDIMTVTTRGDRDHRPVFEMDRRGVFEKEVNAAVSDGRADFAVHSMKDVPGDMSPGLVLASVPRRADPHDIMVCRPGLDTSGKFLVGTSSLRRMAQTIIAFPNSTVKSIRGNVETRISKVGGEFDGVILAQAGLARLGLDVNTLAIPHDIFIPSPGQGALALVCRDDDDSITSMLGSIQHAPSRAEVDAERALSDVLESGCRFPVAACAKYDDGMISIRAAAYGDDNAIYAEATGNDPVAVGQEVAHTLLDQGAASLALKWRTALAGWR